MERNDNEANGLRQHLADRDLPCPGCGYNLRGLPDPVCPECRQELHLTVGLVEPRLGALIAGVGSLCAGAGAAGALLVTILIISGFFRHGLPRGSEQVLIVWLPLACVVSCGLFAVRLCRRSGRVWFRKLPADQRRGVVIAAIALPVGWFGAFLVMLMSKF